MTIQILKQHLLELMGIEDKIRKIQELANVNGVELPEEEELIRKLIKQKLN